MRKSRGVDLIAYERERQRASEGWTLQRDREVHAGGQLAQAAEAYLTARDHGASSSPPVGLWPWHPDWWKPSDDPVRNLVKAGALIAAEIDRLTGNR
jgi:hypothetical protein